MRDMTATDLRGIESRLTAAEYLYADGRSDPNAAACLDWTRAVAMPDMRWLLAEVRRLRQRHYLPIDCPQCDRRRVEYDPVAHEVRCEKCQWGTGEPRD